MAVIAAGSVTTLTAIPPAFEASAGVGQPAFAHVNSLLAATLSRSAPMIVAHRGVATGMVPENTAASTQAALRSGADMVELDVIASADGEFFAFHTGTERQNLGFEIRLEELTADQIGELAYTTPGRRGRLRRIERLEDLLLRFRGSALFNIDRSWHLWPSLLDRLAALNMTEQLLLKAPAGEVSAIETLRKHDAPFPFMLVCRDRGDVFAHADDPKLNLVGIELVAENYSHPLHDDGLIDAIHARSLFTFANAEMLGDHQDLFAGFDDEASLEDDPDLGWGRLIDLGFGAIQTDWPWLLRDYRQARALRTVRH